MAPDLKSSRRTSPVAVESAHGRGFSHAGTAGYWASNLGMNPHAGEQGL